jgi:hypothetical protein
MELEAPSNITDANLQQTQNLGVATIILNQTGSIFCEKKWIMASNFDQMLFLN